MIPHLRFKNVLMIFIVMLTYSTVAGAGTVGRFTMVAGRVDLLKNGNLPAVAVKVEDPVGSGDVIRTKSLSRAQITFVDNSTLTISPESRIAIEEFKFDAAQQKRNAVLKIFQGLALAAVNKIIKTAEPDFIIKTHTAIVGVRGTEIGLRLSPNNSTVLNFKGYTQVGNIFPEVSRLFLKAFKVAFSFNWNNGSNRWVFLKDMQGTSVNFNLPPTKPFTITREDQMQFMHQLATNVSSRSNPPGDLPQTAAHSSVPSVIATPGTPTALNILSTVTVPPTLVPQQAQTAPPASSSSPAPHTRTGGSSGGGGSSYTPPSEY